MQKRHLSVTLATLLIAVYSAHGQATAFTDKDAFLNALPGPAGVLNFEGLVGVTNLSGSTQLVTGGLGTGIIFPSTVTDEWGVTHQLWVVENVNDSNPTTSPSHSLGTDDTDNNQLIVAGTPITLGLTSPFNAFGLSFITPDELFDGDIQLVAGGDTASLAVNDRTLLGNFGGTDYYAYFLGIITGTAFSSVAIQYGPAVSGGPFLYNADDIMVAVIATGVPEPGTPLTRWLAGCLSLAAAGFIKRDF